MKKVISFVLVLALVLGSFSMAFAAPASTGLSDIEKNANETAIKVVNDLGIVTGYPNGTYQPANAVTRAEFAAMITRALDIPESALAGYTTTTFKDTEGFGWAVKYLAFCQDKGIMLGDGNGNAMPGQTITVNEAVTMILRAMGLTNNSALLVGNWPSNYVTIAKSIDLYDDVTAATTVDRATAAQLIYNALTVAGYVVNADGDTTRTNPLIANLAAYDNEDVVTYDPDSLIALAEYIGAYAKIYYNDDDEIVAIDPISTFLTGTYDAATEKLTVNDVDYSIADNAFTTTPGSVTILNGSTSTPAITSFVDDTEYTIAVDYVGKTIKNIYSVVVWDVTVDDYAADDVQDDIADDQKLLGEKFELDNNDEIDAASFQLFGAASLEAIAEDDVVYVYVNPTYHTIVKVEVGTEVVKGTVTKVNSDNDEFTIGGKVYSASNEIISSVPASGDKGTAYLDYAGDIYEWDANDGVTDNYAVVTEEYKTVGRSDTVVILDKTGNEAEYTVDTDEVTWDNTYATVGSIISFALDKNGKIDELTTFDAINLPDKEVSDDYSVIGTYKVASGAVVFVKDGNDFELGKISDLADKITASAILNEDRDEIQALLVDVTYTGNEDSTYGVVNAFGDTLYDEEADEEYTLADIIIDGKTMTDVKTDGITRNDITASNGALSKITIDEDGIITDVDVATDDADVTSILGNVTVSAINGRIITAGTDSYRIAADAVIYVWNDEDEAWEVKGLSAVKKCYVKLYDTDDNTANGYEVVMANEAATLN